MDRPTQCDTAGFNTQGRCEEPGRTDRQDHAGQMDRATHQIDVTEATQPEVMDGGDGTVDLQGLHPAPALSHRLHQPAQHPPVHGVLWHRLLRKRSKNSDGWWGGVVPGWWTPTLISTNPPWYLLRGLGDKVGPQGGEDKLDGVPDLVAEVTVAQGHAHVQADIVTYRVEGLGTRRWVPRVGTGPLWGGDRVPAFLRPLTMDVVGAQGHAEGISAAFGDAVGELTPLGRDRERLGGDRDRFWGDRDGDRSHLPLCGHCELMGVQEPVVEPLLQLLQNKKPYSKQRCRGGFCHRSVTTVSL